MSQGAAKRRKTSTKDAADDADPLLRSHTNVYVGYAPVSKGTAVDRVSYPDVTAGAFDEKYVASRRPVVLKGALEGGSDLRGAAKWTNAFLRKKCASNEDAAPLRVETRSVTNKERFGRGKYVDMSFNAFMDKFEAGDGRWYLSAGGKPDPFSAPASQLVSPATDAADDGLLPLRPRVLPRRLVPADVNLWMGRNDGPTSSGLHHDYHDNLYLLVRGEKRFKLYSPRDAGRMYTTGSISWVHENGLINYSVSTLQDGDISLANGESALEHRLRKGTVANDDESEEEEDGLVDDDDFADFDGVDDYDALNESDDESDDNEEKISKDEKDPDSFSRVDYDDLSEYPLFKGAISMDVVVKAGEALYLPAGWFHDVSSDDSGQGHVAFNYWFHPPPLGESTIRSARHTLREEDFKRSILASKFAVSE